MNKITFSYKGEGEREQNIQTFYDKKMKSTEEQVHLNPNPILNITSSPTSIIISTIYIQQ